VKKCSYLLVFGCVFTVLCNDFQDLPLDYVTARSVYNDKKSSNNYNTIARLIAGLEKCSDESYNDYAKSIASSWKKLQTDSLSLIPKWVDIHVSPYTKNSDTLFYPFGGPDISYAFAFFPNAQKYILVGLEPIGSFTKIEKSLKNQKAYNAIKTACSSYLKNGYFITSEMVTQLSNNDIRGGLNLILLQLAMLDYDILDIVEGGITSSGKFVDTNKGNVDCAKIICKKGKSEKTIYYIRLNLSNTNSRLENLLHFVSQFSFSTFIKSASYALHGRDFSDIRSFILKNTRYILQDDTGIPFAFFKSDWCIQAFGVYTHPTLSVFRLYKQPSLFEFFHSNPKISIPYKIGYGYNQCRPNLLGCVPKRPSSQIAESESEAFVGVPTF